MSLARWGPESDVYVYTPITPVWPAVHGRGPVYHCCTCYDPYDPDALYPSLPNLVLVDRHSAVGGCVEARADAMTRHLQEHHEAHGDAVPPDLYHALRRGGI